MRQQVPSVWSQSMNRRQALKTAGGLLAAGAAGLNFPSKALGSTPKQPNIIFILTDDHRWDAFSILDHPVVETPNLDHVYCGLIGPLERTYRKYMETLYATDMEIGRVLSKVEELGIPDMEAVRTTRYKYIKYQGHKPDELFDLLKDAREQNNIIKTPWGTEFYPV